MKPWHIIEEKIVYSALPWLEVALQRVRLPDGREVDDYHRIRTPDFAMIFAVTNDERVVVERMYKHGLQANTTVLPAGRIDPGESPLQAAHRELLEETGYASRDWESLGEFVIHSNYGLGTGHFFLATEAKLEREPQSGDLEDIMVELLSINDLTEAVESGEVKAMSTALLVMMAVNRLAS